MSPGLPSTRFVRVFSFFLLLSLFPGWLAQQVLREQEKMARMPVLFNPIDAIKKKSSGNTIDTNQLKQSDWYGKIMKEIEQSEYEIGWNEKAKNYEATNRVYNLRSYFDGRQLQMQPMDNNENWKLEFQVKAIMGDKNVLYNPISKPQAEKQGQEITFSHGDQFKVQYINNKEGVRENFIITQAPANAVKQLSVCMTVNKGWYIGQAHRGELHFAKRNGRKLDKKITYNSLKAWDANNKELAAKFVVNDEKNEIDIVVDAANAVYPVTIDPLSTTGDWIKEINFAQGYFGASVASAGDVNGDGFDDVIVGAPGYNFQQTNEGSIFVFHGSPTGLSTTINFRYELDYFDAYFGSCVAGVGDVNGDGYDDVMAGAPNYAYNQNYEGRVYIFFGSGSGLSSSDLDWKEIDVENAFFGSKIAAAGDVDNDGYDDVLISAPGYSNGQSNEGIVFLYSGGSAGISINPVWQKEGNQDDLAMGYEVAGAGDVNNDGFADVVIGADLFDGGQSDEGKISIYHGSPAGLLTNPAREIESNTAGLGLGYAVAGAGDINGDGYDDIIADARDNAYDKIHFYYGSGSGINGTGGVIVGPEYAGYGACVESAGDVNNDGYDDIIVTANTFSNGQIEEGAAFLYYGSSNGPSATANWTYETNQQSAAVLETAGAGDINGDGFDDMIIGVPGYDNGQDEEGISLAFYGSLSGVDLSADQMIESNTAGMGLGVNVSGAGDVNGDGFSDVVVSSSFGRVFIYHGSATGLNSTAAWSAEGNQPGEQFGFSVSLAGDINKDGFGDIVIGAPYFSNGQTHEGRVVVYYGSPGGLQTSPAWVKESDKAGAFLGWCVALAGDVNKDGYSDIMADAKLYSNGETMEGAVFVFHGSADGLSQEPDWTSEGNIPYLYYGASVAGAGDVNGDGASDIIIGTTQFTNDQIKEGRALVYYGSETGLSNQPDWTAEGNQQISDFGCSVSSAGDVNGDGFSDVIVGAQSFENGKLAEGRVFLFYGSASGLSGVAGWTTEGNQEGAGMGVSVESCGDMNGDGYGDIAVGVPGYSNKGAIFIYYGSSTGPSSSAERIIKSNRPSALLGYYVSSSGDINGDGYSDMIVGDVSYSDGQVNEGAILIYHGSSQSLTTQSSLISAGVTGDQFGYSVASAGDVNGDGYDDVIVGVPFFASNNRGKVFLYHGGPGGLSASAAWSAEGTNNSLFGYSVASAGDVNGDGLADVIIGARSYSGGQSAEGRAYVYLGTAGALTLQWTMESDLANADFGSSVASAGDVNADGYADVIIGASNYSNGEIGEGRAYVYYGSQNGVVSANPWIAESNQAYAAFGASVASTGDFNGDGYSDVAVGAYLYDFVASGEEGAVFVYRGSKNGLSQTPVWTMYGSAFVSGFGCSIASAGDVNGDGFSDLLVGSLSYDETNEGGRAYVYHGSATGLSLIANWEAGCAQPMALFGFNVNTAGDLNGDGYTDIAIGAPEYDLNQPTEGRVFIYSGSQDGLSATPGLEFEGDVWNYSENPEFGSSICSAGDVNGDGYCDFIAGAPGTDIVSTNQGAIYVYYGNRTASNKHNDLDLYNTDLATPINAQNRNVQLFGAGLFVKSPQGRTKARLVWEVKKPNESFSAMQGRIDNSTQYTSKQTGFTDLSQTGVELKSLIRKTGLRTKIRARVEYDKAGSLTGQVYGPWRYSSDYLRGAMGMSAVPLPLELLSFTGKLVNDHSELKWKTANEENTSCFEVQRSLNGRDFETIGRVNAAGAGDHDYIYTDNYVFTTKAYYRLKMVDTDGTSSYSKVVVLKKSTAISWDVYPNPVVKDGSVTIGINSAGAVPGAKLQVVDLGGRVVMEKAMPLIRGYQTIELKAVWGAGQYILKLLHADGLTETKRIVVQ